MSTAAGPPADGSAGSGHDRCTAPGFSVADLAMAQETDLSRIFRDLLDPAGCHAQGATFLRCLLKELRASCPEKVAAFPSAPGAGSRVSVEHQTGLIGTDGSGSRGKIDIFVELEDGRCIAIENKPWALEQPEQIKRYLCYLGSLKSPTANVVLLYWIGWSGKGSDPDLSELQKDLQDRYVRMPYGKTLGSRFPSVEGWLRRCKKKCKAPRVTSYLGDLIRYVRRKFPDIASLLYDQVETLEKELGKALTKCPKGWLFKQTGWSRDEDWSGVWIWRQKQESLRFEVGASGWPECAKALGESLRDAGEKQLGALLKTDAWTPHCHNEEPKKRHVSWTFEGDRVSQTDDLNSRDDRERRVKEIMDLVKALMKEPDS